MILEATISGDDNGLPPVLLAHGLFGSGRNLGGLARKLTPTRKVISVDMRNHGDSPRSSAHSYPALADDLQDVIAAHGGIADLVGHSMGGKAAMTLALGQPDLVRRLVVMDIAPIGYDHSQAGLINAMQRLDLEGLRSRSDADRRLLESVPDAGVRAFLLQSLDLKSDPAVWKLNLDTLSSQLDLIIGWPATLRKAAFTRPVLFLAGGLSDYCKGDAAKSAIFAYFPQAELQQIEGAGHWLHAEKPAVVADAVERFLNSDDA